MRIDSALSTSAKFGTRAQPSLFFPLGFQPSNAVANDAVTFPLPAGIHPAGIRTTGSALTVASGTGPGRELPVTGTYRGPGHGSVARNISRPATARRRPCTQIPQNSTYRGRM